ncbi:hypothetical protein DL98DRAFT_275708 [Cadophora sp. DSE1049]|nr:hypothetical protein DL98DRAFT_275708 [Cadophora sp. DSE1049]
MAKHLAGGVTLPALWMRGRALSLTTLDLSCYREDQTSLVSDQFHPQSNPIHSIPSSIRTVVIFDDLQVTNLSHSTLAVGVAQDLNSYDAKVGCWSCAVRWWCHPSPCMHEPA